MSIDISALLLALVPLYIIGAAGAVAQITNIIDRDFAKKLFLFAVNVCEPFLIVFSMSIERTSERVIIALAVLGAAAVFFAALTLLARFIYAKADKSEFATREYGLIFGATAFLSYPILQSIFPQSGLFYAAVFNIVANIFLKLYGTFLIGNKEERKNLPKRILLDPVTVAAFIGILIFLTGIKMPGTVLSVVETIGSLSVPFYTVAVGALIASTPMKTIFETSNIVSVLTRNILIPLVVCAVCAVAFMDKGLTFVIVAMASAATEPGAALCSGENRVNESVMTGTVCLSSLLSVITVPLMLLLTDFIFRLLGR